MKKTTLIIVMSMMILIGGVIADVIISNDATIDIPQEDIDVLKEWYNLSEINPTASEITEYNGICEFTLKQGDMGYGRIEFDCSRMDSKERIAERDKLIKTQLMFLANVTRDRQARINATSIVDAGGNITVAASVG